MHSGLPRKTVEQKAHPKRTAQRQQIGKARGPIIPKKTWRGRARPPGGAPCPRYGTHTAPPRPLRHSTALFSTLPRAHAKPAGHGTAATPSQRVCHVTLVPLADEPHAVCRQVAVSVGSCGPVLVSMKCFLCAAVMPDGHTQRTCKLHKYCCRHSLPEGHPLRPSRADFSCTDLSCAHRKTCSTCKQSGHQHDTLALHPGRNQVTKVGNILRLPTNVTADLP